MTTYDAIAILEGFSDHEPTLEDNMNAWALLIETGQCWTLQGWYGRNAAGLIQDGLISETGKIDWEKVAERYQCSIFTSLKLKL